MYIKDNRQRNIGGRPVAMQLCQGTKIELKGNSLTFSPEIFKATIGSHMVELNCYHSEELSRFMKRLDEVNIVEVRLDPLESIVAKVSIINIDEVFESDDLVRANLRFIRK